MSALIALTAVGCNGAKEADGGKAGSSGAAADGRLSFTMSMATSGNKHAERSKDVNEERWVKELEKLTHTDIHLTMLPLKDFIQSDELDG